MKWRILPVACFVYLTVANLIWIARDNRPPFWDMAYHQTASIRIVDAFQNEGIAAIAKVPFLTGFYPPVYHSIVAVLYGVFGVSPKLGQLANIPAALILILATFAIARTLLPPPAAAAAAALVTFYPIMIWLSRAAMIDYWLSSLVALALWLLLRTKGFTDRPASILFGVVCGIGLLTKASFVVFVGLPALWAARSHWKHAFMAATIAIAIAVCWYVPQWNTFTAFYAFNSASGVAEGDPARISWQGLLFYVRAMEGYQLFLPLFVLFLFAVVRLARSFNSSWIPITLWILGGWFGLMLLENKDPRYAMPLLPAVAIVTAKLFERRVVWIAVLVPFLLLQHFAVSFGVSWLPEEVVLSEGPPGVPTWNWNLFTQSYAALWGRPIAANWRVDEVLEKVVSDPSQALSRPVRLGLVPDIPSFDVQAFEFEILRRRSPVTIGRVAIHDEVSLRSNDFILTSLDDVGYARISASELEGINRSFAERPADFELIDSFRLPAGAAIRLYKLPNTIREK